MTYAYQVTVDGDEFEYLSGLKIWDGDGDAIAEAAVEFWYDDSGFEGFHRRPDPLQVTVTYGGNTREFAVYADFSPTFTAYEK